jgi:transcriptional regulator with XRE-family HTH domain
MSNNVMTNNNMSKQINKLPLGIFFRKMREEKGLLLRQVAAVTELDQAIISRIENGDRLPTKEQLIKLAGWQAATGQDASSISANPLFTGTELHLQDPASRSSSEGAAGGEEYPALICYEIQRNDATSSDHFLTSMVRLMILPLNFAEGP